MFNKKKKEEVQESEIQPEEKVEIPSSGCEKCLHYSKSTVPIIPLAIDYSNEGLNDIARKINQIIERIN